MYNGAGRYKIKNPAYNGKGSFVQGLALTVTEDTSMHHDVTCFDGGDGSITVVASGGTAPYIYSLDPSFATYNTTGVFDGLSITGPVEEGTDEYGGILVCHKTVYARDANGRIGYTNVRLQSPVELAWLNVPEDIVLHCDEGENYATYTFVPPVVNTTANRNTYPAYRYETNITNLRPNYPIGTTVLQQTAINDCREQATWSFKITVLPNE